MFIRSPIADIHDYRCLSDKYLQNVQATNYRIVIDYIVTPHIIRIYR